MRGQGLRFESHWPCSTRFYANKCETCDFDGGGRTISQWAFPLIKIFFSIFKSRFCIFYKKVSTGGWHNWTACRNGFLQAVGSYNWTACRNEFLHAVLSYLSVEKFISTGQQRRRFVNPPVERGCEPSVYYLCVLVRSSLSSAKNNTRQRAFCQVFLY